MNKSTVRQRIHRYTLVWMACSLAACSTISNPLVRTNADYTDIPTDTLRQVAVKLEAGVAEENRQQTLTDQEGLVINTPEIVQALRSRAARATLVQELLNSGYIMEQRDGKISILRSKAYRDAYTSAQKDRHALIVISENRDRDLIHASIQKANNYSPSGRSAIEEIFSAVRIMNLNAGQKYQGIDNEVHEKS